MKAVEPYNQNLFDAYDSLLLKITWRHLMTSDDLYTIFKLLLEGYTDPLKMGPFFPAIKEIHKYFARTTPVEYEPSVQKRFDECMIIYTIYYYIVPAPTMCDLNIEDSLLQQKEIKEMAERLSGGKEQYVQWLYDEFMKRKEQEVFFYSKTERQEARAKEKFIRKLLLSGAKEHK